MMNKKTEKKRISSCDICMNYTYDEDYECYTCEVDLDEDEMQTLIKCLGKLEIIFRDGNAE